MSRWRLDCWQISVKLLGATRCYGRTHLMGDFQVLLESCADLNDTVGAGKDNID